MPPVAPTFDASESKPTAVPSGESSAFVLDPFVPPPVDACDASATVPEPMFTMNTSGRPLLSPVTRFVASDSKVSHAPSHGMFGLRLSPLPCVPVGLVDMRRIVFAARSATKTSFTPLVSPGTRLFALDSKNTKRPSSVMRAFPESAFAAVLPVPTVTSRLPRLCVIA